MTQMPTTHGLQHADLEPSSIEKDLDHIQKCEARVAELEARLADTLAELNDARACLAGTTRAVEWKRLMAQVEEYDEASKLSANVEDAVELFRRSLQSPSDYDDKEISYSDTDDYADLGPLETVFEDTAATIEERLEMNSAKPLHMLARRSSSTSPKLTSQTASMCDNEALATKPRSMAPDQNDKKAVERFKTMLLLLVLSVHSGCLEKECRVDTIPDPSNRPMAAIDEIRENVASLWNMALITSPVLTHPERELWQHVATTFLGPPFDPSVSS